MGLRHHIGTRYGRLTITGIAFRRGGKPYVDTRCDCGNEKVAQLGMLRSGETQICGCLFAETMEKRRAASNVGAIFHSWTVIADSPRRGTKGDRYVIARCQCGTERETLTKVLRSGLIKDCGCKRDEWAPLMRMHGRHLRASELIGQTVGTMTIRHIANELDDQGAPRVMAECSCGEATVVDVNRLRGSTSPNCGRLVHLAAHGLSLSTEYTTHNSMIKRCHNPASPGYRKYGARGITVCDRWRFGEDGKTGFQCFLEDMGRRPADKHSIDRIDNYKGYEPGNCRWATWQEQAANRRPRGWRNASAEPRPAA